MSGIEEIAQYHEDLANAAAWAADRAQMPHSRGLDAQADRHARWAAVLRALLPPAREPGPKLQGGIGGGR